MNSRDVQRRSAIVAAGALSLWAVVVAPSMAEESGAASPEPSPTATTNVEQQNPDWVPPETVDTYVGQSVQSRRTADGVQNSELANFRWTVTQVNAESLNGLDVSVPLPMADAPGLRSLTGSSNMPTEVEGGVLFDFDDVNGIQTKRTLNLWPQDQDLPVDVRAEFTLNGDPVQAQEIVGQGGLVTAKYTIVNNTVQTQDVAYTNVKDEPATQAVDTSQAFVGISKQFIPQSWAQFDPGNGIYGADGRGNFQTQWITLAFLPFAEGGEASFGWSAVIPDGQGFIPKMVIEVSPLYVPPHAAEGEETTAESQNGVPKPNLDPATSTIHAGVQSLIAGIEGIAALLPEKPPCDPAVEACTLPDKLAALQAGLTTLSGGLAELETRLSDAIASPPAPIDPTTVQGYIDQIDATLATLDRQIEIINEELRRGEGSVQGPGTSCTSNPAAAYCGVLEGAKSTLQETKVQLTAIRAGLVKIQEGGGAQLTEGVLTELLTQVQQVKAKVDGVLADLTTLNTTIGQAQDLAAQAAAGKAQISAGVGMASAEVQAYIAQVVAQAQVAAAEGQAAAAEAEVALNTVKAEMAGLKGRMAESPLPYSGGMNTVYAAAGEAEQVQTQATSIVSETGTVEAEGVQPTTELFGAYQFMLDPADTNKSSTPWRIALALLCVVGAGLIGMRVTKRAAA